MTFRAIKPHRLDINSNKIDSVAWKATRHLTYNKMWLNVSGTTSYWGEILVEGGAS